MYTERHVKQTSILIYEYMGKPHIDVINRKSPWKHEIKFYTSTCIV